ncbi:hypothetical protein A3B60_04100 [Candidatus Peregrinibacteria bacterium RIFCSPLOWO2_01_FULL_39_12]|nr:MAG: hypothetical protein A3B60_04100 [Candidatus Peregrinibacteria bacterium RIFCSPLOWO2_01_FULL_39_12]
MYDDDKDGKVDLDDPDCVGEVVATGKLYIENAGEVFILYEGTNEYFYFLVTEDMTITIPYSLEQMPVKVWAYADNIDFSSSHGFDVWTMPMSKVYPYWPVYPPELVMMAGTFFAVSWETPRWTNIFMQYPKNL